jgi:hypothetical protein
MIKQFTVAISILLLVTGCYPSITGTVVDAKTGEPVEGAIILAQWTQSHGIGLTYHTVYKVLETETDKAGRFSIPGVYSFFVDSPILVIYKKSYVAWRNDLGFPEFKRRTDFKWQDNFIVRLERFKEDFSRDQHHMFLVHGIMGSSLEKTPKYYKAESGELEEALRIKRKSN